MSAAADLVEAISGLIALSQACDRETEEAYARLGRFQEQLKDAVQHGEKLPSAPKFKMEWKRWRSMLKVHESLFKDAQRALRLLLKDDSEREAVKEVFVCLRSIRLLHAGRKVEAKVTSFDAKDLNLIKPEPSKASEFEGLGAAFRYIREAEELAKRCDELMEQALVAAKKLL
ncbi:MAG TPA: hypothetical protein PKA27_06210 [Fimbriimonadaceae bacterium]|nr:hypothetical protein [Fimbriimonadaceae bacterium]